LDAAGAKSKAPAADAGAAEDAAGEEAVATTPAALLKAALEDRLKTDADEVSRRLMQLRLAERDRDVTRIQELTAERQALRRADVARLLRRALRRGAASAAAGGDPGPQGPGIGTGRRAGPAAPVDSAGTLRGALQDFEIAASVSLPSVQPRDGFGAFNYGWLYPLRPRINRVPAYAALDQALREGAPARGRRPA